MGRPESSHLTYWIPSCPRVRHEAGQECHGMIKKKQQKKGPDEEGGAEMGKGCDKVLNIDFDG